MGKAFPLSPGQSALLAAALFAAASAPAYAAGGAGEPQAARNVTATLLTEFTGLQGVVAQAWHDLEDVSAVVRPQVTRLSLQAEHMQEVLKDARKLRVPSVDAVCEDIGSSCSKCAESSICGWCTASMKCVPGSRNGPGEDGSCPAAQYSYESCPGMGCKGFNSCDLCTADAMCGWCSSSSTCIDGTEWGPSRAALALPFLAARVPCNVASQPNAYVQQVAPSQDKQCGLGGTIGWVHRDSQTSQTCPAI